MRLYELVVVLKASLSEAQRKKVLDTIKSWLKDVTVTKENVWGQKVLAYPIKKEATGYYVQFILETASNVPAEAEQRMIQSEDVLRHLLVRTK